MVDSDIATPEHSSKKRFFYTDPLAAAWQAKHFGMKLTYVAEDRSDGELGPPCMIECMEWYDRNVKRFYIHRDSLQLLEPKAGDVLYAGRPGAISIEQIISEERISTAKYLIRRGSRIIQRNGIPFHWPGGEEA
jgi:hypothetical protein